MSSQWPSAPADPWSGQEDWNSPLWGHPDTQAAAWPAAPEQTAPAIAPPPPPSGPSKRAILAAGAAVLVAIMVLGLLVTGALPRHSTDNTATATTPSIAAPVTPSQTAPSL